MNSMIYQKVLLLFLISLSIYDLQSQSRLFYVGNNGNEVFHDVVQLSDGTILISGAADHLDWIPPGTTKVDLGSGTITNNQGSNRFAFLMQTDSTLSQILNLVYISQGGAEDIRFIKTTNVPRMTTGSMFISGTTEDSGEGGYFIGKLNNNFVNGIPTDFEWTYNAKCDDGDYPKENQPWDVDAAGRVYFVRGDSHDWNWSIMHRLDENGTLDVVEHWRTHWKAAGGEFRGTPASNAGEELTHSGIVFKRDGRCNLRSWTQADYDLVQSDENGGSKQGKWPLDVLFDAPCDPNGETPTSGPGYTGYKPGSGSTYGPSSLCVDRRTGDVFLGINAKSILPDGNPDFEPAIIRFDAEGTLKWWSRLYHEMRADLSTHNSSPDQYIDGIAVNYASPLPAGEVVVNARCHGNNVENFWEGNTLFHNPNAGGFQNRFTGTSGNIHISWLGKLSIDNGHIQHSTYVAELAQGATGIGSPLSDPNLDGWPNPNAGWPTLNTTRLTKNTLKTTADGSVIVIGKGRRPLTTANAYFKMPNPYYGGLSAWSFFVRQYTPTLSKPVYSTIVRDQWDTLSTQPSLEVELYNSFKTQKGIIVVGQYTGTDGNLLISEVPTWGKAQTDQPTAVIGYFEADLLNNPADSPTDPVVTNTANPHKPLNPISIFPNPTSDQLLIQSPSEVQQVEVFDLLGRQQFKTSIPNLSLKHLVDGTYVLKISLEDGNVYFEKVVKR